MFAPLLAFIGIGVFFAVGLKRDPREIPSPLIGKATRTGADVDGRVGIDWGVYGVPETFVVDRSGRIAYKHIGPITREAWNGKLLPLIRELQAAR